MQALNKKVPLVYSMHNSISVLERPLGGMAALEGDYEAYSLAIAGADESEARRFYNLLAAKHGLKAQWNSFAAIGIAQALVLVRSVEAGARKYGGDKLTGELMYQTLINTHFVEKDFFGYVGGDVDFSVEAPFPLRDPRINIGYVNGGKLTTIASGVAVPKLAKW
jgi:branched-chain amino acid transport system substrate-binding protein